MHTADALVVGSKPGQGKHAGLLGAFECLTRAGVRFFVGTGLSDAERAAPPAKTGDVIEVRCSRSGIMVAS
jgi:ATP-dependent DNA ligase